MGPHISCCCGFTGRAGHRYTIFPTREILPVKFKYKPAPIPVGRNTNLYPHSSGFLPRHVGNLYSLPSICRQIDMGLARCVVDAYVCQIFHVPGARRLRILARQWSYLDTLAKLEIKVSI